MKKRSFYKDISRTLRKNLSRFIAIVVMVALGSGVFAGFAVGCLNVFKSANRFYASQNMYDIKIASTLGLTEDDLTAISNMAGVSKVFGNCSLDVKAMLNDGKSLQANLTTLDTNGMNEPYVLEGTLPTKSGQIAVNSKFIDDTGLKLGDIITLAKTDNAKETVDTNKEADTGEGDDTDLDITVDSDSSEPTLAVSKYEITAIILSPLDIDNKEGSIASISFSAGSSGYLLYAKPNCIDSNIYTAIYLTIGGAAKLECYSEEYQSLVDDITSRIEETIQKEREQARYDEVVGNANAKIAYAEDMLSDKMTEAEQKLADAKEDIANISMTKWYVWDRSDNDSFAGLHSDISFIQEITKAFPFIFFLVAILISLTTMTRMVEEDRGLIGTYKSLGYSKIQISMKYILYSVLACVFGGILGTVIGFYALPKIIEIIVNTLYVLPTFQLSFYPSYGLGGFGLFLLGIVGATVISCAELLHKRPADLMRPKAPKAGNRILLERVPLLWKRLNFLNKVTCRNLFRYKKRAVMTIVGILGCAMLIVFGFGIRDTVGGLMSDQFDTITVYDAIVVTDDLSTDEMKDIANEWNESKMVKSELQLKTTTLTLHSKRHNLDITVMVIPDGADLGDYVHLKDSVTHKAMFLPSDGIVVTQNAAKQLKINNGDIVSLQNEENLEHDFPVAFIAANYAGNYVYISESCYQAAFGDYLENSFLLNMSDNPNGQEWLVSLGNDKRILAVSDNQEVRDSFSDVNQIINMIVYILIGMAAVLAFAVLFTLSNINISERERELATVKVLGFLPKEVYSYVNKETLILTLLGILLGLPTGYGITYLILSNVSIADVAFKVRVSGAAYLIAAVLTMVFTLIVNHVTNKALHLINMVEALKSVE